MSNDETQKQASTADAITMTPVNRGSKLVILSASSGSGHTRAGEALEAAAAHVPGISSVRHIDVLEYGSALLAEVYADLYKQMVSKPQRLAGMRDRMKQLARPRAAYTILETMLGTQQGVT